MMKLCIPTKVLEQHLVVLGKTGAGKSSALRHIVEWLLSKQKRVCVVDPKGDWYGLKSSDDGRGAGFPVILFGSFKDSVESDVPLDSHAGKPVAELIAGGNRPCVIGLRGWAPSDMTRFWIDFASTLFNGESGELYLVVDEVHNFAPKGKVLSPEAGKCLHWTNRLINEGRGLGMVCLIASQRPQKVHNDTLTACETLVAMRVIHAADRGAVEDWIKGCGDKDIGATVLAALAGMKRGEAFVWSPEIDFGPERITFPMFTTFDSFAPRRLQRKFHEEGWASVDLVEVNRKLAAVIQKAKSEDPRELQRRVRELEQQLRAKQVLAPPVDEKAIQCALADGRKQWEAERRGLIKTIQQSVSGFAQSVMQSARALELNIAGLAVNNGHERPVVRPDKPLTSKVRQAETPKREPSEGLTGPEQRILDAIAWMESIGIDEPEQTAVAFLAGYKIGGGAFNNPRGSLRVKGLVEYRGDRITLTEQGRASANDPGEPLTPEEIQSRVLQRLPGPEGKLLRELLAEYPNALSNEELAERCNYTAGGGAFNNPKGRLRTLGLIEYPAQGQSVARSILFLE